VAAFGALWHHWGPESLAPTKDGPHPELQYSRLGILDACRLAAFEAWKLGLDCNDFQITVIARWDVLVLMFVFPGCVLECRYVIVTEWFAFGCLLVDLFATV
jgi:hypothetical protein